MLTHDTGACVINNRGPGPDDGNDDTGDDNDEEEMVPNQGVIIEEVHEDEARAEEVEQEGDHVQAEYECNVVALETENDDKELWSGAYREMMFSEDYNHVEMFNEVRNGGNMSHKRKAWMQDANAMRQSLLIWRLGN